MKTLLEITGLPIAGLLMKWTALLALGWIAHQCLRARDARWRLILWRSILVFSAALPVICALSLPLPSVAILDLANTLPVETVNPSRTLTATAVPENVAVQKSPVTEKTGFNSTLPMPLVEAHHSIPKIPWELVAAAFYLMGFTISASRLFRFQRRLARLRLAADLPPGWIAELADELGKRLQLRGMVDLRLSTSVQSPFVFGVLRPAIMLPWRLAEDLSRPEATVLLRHELAHLRGHDLVWTTGWRWLQVFGWFHPLVWKIPAAHSLACEQEADRVASGRSDERESYAQLLAQLALRVVALPAVETKLTLNGAAQIVRRLEHLKRRGAEVWRVQHTLAGLALATLIFLLAAGCELSRKDAARPAQFKAVTVLVQNEDGQPVSGARITPTGFRVKGIHGADAYGWRTNVFGPKEAVITGPDGKVSLKYAVMGIPEEKELTGALTFTVNHPDYSSVMIQDYRVDKSNEPIRLIRGITVEVSAYCGSQRAKVGDFVPRLASGEVLPEDWQKGENGVLLCNQLSPGGQLIQLMGKLPSDEIGYSETTFFTAEKGKISRLELELKPGIRLEGRLDDRVPRPVKGGRVMMSVRPKEYPALSVIEDYYDLDKKYGSLRQFWQSYRPINADGSFVFESVPPGEADVVVLGDGFASLSEGQLSNRVNGVLVNGPVTAIPQKFSLTAPITRIEVRSEPTAVLEFSAKTKAGRPIEAVWVGMYPSVFRMWGPYGWRKMSSEAPYRELPQLPDLVFSGRTGQDGKLIIPNIPAETHGLEVDSTQYQVPLQQPKGWRDRHVRIAFVAGATNHLEMVLEPKGTDFIGTAK